MTEPATENTTPPPAPRPTTIANLTDEQIRISCEERGDHVAAQMDAMAEIGLTNVYMIQALGEEVLRLRALVSAEPSDAMLATTIWTYAGGLMRVFDPDPETINVYDIARGLATHFRYNGQTTEPYTVAEHSVYVARAVAPEFARQALLHDATEAFIGDIARPIKRHPSMAAYVAAERKLEDAIFARFGVVRTPESDAAVKDADSRILVDEVTQIVRDADTTEKGTQAGLMARFGAPIGVTIRCLGILDAEALFLHEFHRLFRDVL